MDGLSLFPGLGNAPGPASQLSADPDGRSDAEGWYLPAAGRSDLSVSTGHGLRRGGAGLSAAPEVGGCCLCCPAGVCPPLPGGRFRGICCRAGLPGVSVSLPPPYAPQGTPCSLAGPAGLAGSGCGCTGPHPDPNGGRLFSPAPVRLSAGGTPGGTAPLPLCHRNQG